MVKINESLNRVFLLRFNNGCEAIARFPTSLAGPSHFTTASEVATIDFLRRRLGFPIPAVLAWNSRAESTDVGAEFILMEKASGCLLSDVLGDLPRAERGMFAKTLGECERQLLELKFTHYGSLYYKDDIPAPLRAPTLLEGISPDDELNSIFCIGPIARRDFWEAERGSMNIDRGPWHTAEDYMTAVARREQDWIHSFSTLHILDDPNRILPGQGSRDDHVALLSVFTTLVPILVPCLHEQARPVMWHPDLHASNIFVEYSEEQGTISPTIPLTISSIIDWQGTWIGPAFLQLQVPPLYRMDGVPPGRQLPVLPENFEELCASEKAEVEESHKRRIHHKLFELAAFPLPIFNMKARQERIYLEDLAQVTWKYGLIPFRMALFHIYQLWEDIIPESTCPVEYSSEELDDLEAHHTMWLRHREMLEDLDRTFNLGEFGYIKGDLDQFEKVRLAVEQKKLEYIECGKDDEAKRVRALLWPYRDTLRDHDITTPLVLPSESQATRL
ncbi:hypothetical protein SERLA73DRAFT_182452 [Serpula lacrymans var. lacrymans S7.3]|uniref:Altered inheritance of mitochondria protein 9, mitochondrial n=2 Tax=Serpula lacrymans var. lacrymans TaxID=341189 RepID=F8PXG3_SERL3|nr:uncharacterized protein SERLADRAFT_469111 [Serpula lacrymans var. lacrymans S7.9]EGN99489.1 hypothetical protein SERLA73DRAFT_182452 [Serpula lacrymans var. lacrymans S7.3]EGO25042.1 hypothetical protein SERLADRAFT_469111 [Serpula lacrymans var. lacrymans S7.9]